ncbi:MAG TPA: M24 family metallopeptidase [Bryobacteraceae bacterium]|nr:M24 family metallopeptidase [Bryobacteraceae bacterium]
MPGSCSLYKFLHFLTITRTFVIGQPTDKMKRLFDIVHQAQGKAMAAAHPGLPCEAVDDDARKAGYKYFSHRLGHGLGLGGHEWPHLPSAATTIA